MKRARMRASALATALVVAVAGSFAAAADEPATAPPGEAAPIPSGPPGRNRVMGTGESLAPAPFTLEQRFLQAVRDADRKAIERCLELGVSANASDDLGRSALALAARDAGSLELVRLLRERGAEPDPADVAGRTPLSFAAGRGRAEIVRYLAGQGAAVDVADHQGRTPLFYAALGDHTEALAFLLEQGARVDVHDRFGDTPLIAACAKGNAATASHLIARGADSSARDQEGRTARQRAAPGTTPCLAPPAAAPGAQ